MKFVKLILASVVALATVAESKNVRGQHGSSAIEESDRVLNVGEKGKNSRKYTTKGSKMGKGGKKGKDGKSGKKGKKKCNTMDPQCGLKPSEAQAMYLITYDDLVDKLYDIQEKAKEHIEVGPLIKNEDNGGLLDIDVSLKDTGSCENDAVDCDICGPGTAGSVTVREAVICTVSEDPFPMRGNSIPAKIGKSTGGMSIKNSSRWNRKILKYMSVIVSFMCLL